MTSAHDGEGAQIEERRRDAQGTLQAAAEDAFAKFLGPFAETFAVLHAVELGDLPTSAAMPELDLVDAKTRAAAVEVVEVLIAVGGTAGIDFVLAGLRNLPTTT